MSVQHINLQIDCHRVSLMIEREQEESYRQAATLLNDTYKQFRKNWPQRSVEELWIYVSLQMAVNFLSDIKSKDLQPVQEKVAELNAKIMENLKVDK